MGRAALTRAPLQVEDIRHDPDMLVPAVLDQLLAVGLHSVLAVPLLREDRVLGRASAAARRTPGAFPDEVVALLQTLATQSALAIHNARLYQTPGGPRCRPSGRVRREGQRLAPDHRQSGKRCGVPPGWSSR